MSQINLCDNRFFIYIPNFHIAKKFLPCLSVVIQIKTYKMSTVTIWCLVRGSSSAFYITIDRNNFIIDFKDAIKNKKPNVFANVDADQLVLWKLKNPADESHISDIQNYTLQ